MTDLPNKSSTYSPRIFVRLGLAGLMLLLTLAWGQFGVASEPAKKLTDLIDPVQVETLSLQEAVLRTLKNNLDITVSRQSLHVRLTDILFQQAQFDPTVELSGRYGKRVDPLNRPIFGFGGSILGEEPDNIDQTDTNFRLGLNQKLLTGGIYELSFDGNRNAVAGQTSFLFNPAITSNFLFNLDQPLLRNFGPEVNSTQIKIARNAATVEQFTFINQVLTVIADVEQTYWELVFAREGEKVAKATLKAAQVLLADNRARFQAGVMAEVEVLQAQAGVANRVEEVLIAQKAIGDQEDQLRQLFSPSEASLSDVVAIVPVDKPRKDADPLSLEKTIGVALRQRPEVLQAQKAIDTSDLNTKLAKNQMLPNLTFQGELGLRGLGGEANDALDRNFSTDFYNVGGGLVLTYPLGNRAAQSQYNRRILETNRAQVSLQRIRRQVVIEVKEAIRRVRTDFKRMTTTRAARQLAEKQLNAEEERLNLGLSTTRFVLEFQRDLAISRRNELRAMLDYNKSLAHLRRTNGTALDTYKIVLQS